MSEESKHERAAIAAVAKRFGARWEESADASGGYFRFGGKRIRVEVAEVKAWAAGKRRPAKFRLRFDKVALRVVADLHDALRESVPHGKTVIVTITAPIRLASKTTEALGKRIRKQLARRSTSGNASELIHGNRIGIRVANGSAGGKKVIGFVHNPDPRAEILLDVACALIEVIAPESRKPAPLTSADGRWLILASRDGPGHVETYKQAYSLLAVSSGFDNVLMAFEGRQVETLSG